MKKSIIGANPGNNFDKNPEIVLEIAFTINFGVASRILAPSSNRFPAGAVTADTAVETPLETSLKRLSSSAKSK